MANINYIWLKIDVLEMNSFLEFLKRAGDVFIYVVDKNMACIRLEKAEKDFKQLMKEANVLGISIYKDRDIAYGLYNK